MLGAVALAGAALVSMNSYWSRSAMPAAVSKLMVEPSAAELEVALRRSGLTPDRLAAAGLEPAAVGAVISAARAYLTEHALDLSVADERVATARTQADGLRRRIESGLAEKSDVPLLASAEASLSDALAAQEAVLLALYTTSVGGLDGPQKATLARMRSNGAWDLPTPYLTAERQEPGWVGLRDDLTNLRVASQLGEEPDPACQQAVAAANADPAVAAAATNLSNRLSVVTQAWNEAIGG